MQRDTNGFRAYLERYRRGLCKDVQIQRHRSASAPKRSNASIDACSVKLGIGAEMLRQMLRPVAKLVPIVLNNVDKVMTKLEAPGHSTEAMWEEQTVVFRTVMVDAGPSFEAVASKSAAVIESVNSLNRQLETEASKLTESITNISSAWKGLKTTINDFRELAETDARKHKSTDATEDSNPTEAKLTSLVGTTARRFATMTAHAQMAKDIVDAMKGEVERSTPKIQLQLNQLSPILSEERNDFMDLSASVDPALNSFRLHMLVAYGLAIFVVLSVFAFGMKLYTWDPTIRDERLPDKNYVRGICAFQKDHPSFDRSFTQSLCGPVTRQCLRMRYMCGNQVLSGCALTLLAILLFLTIVLIFCGCCWAWIQIVTIRPLDAVCRTQALEMLTSNDNCTKVIRSAEAAVNTTVLLPGETCAESHLLMCTQLVQPLMTSLLTPGIALVVAFASTVFMWPLLDRQLSLSFEDALAYVAFKVGV